MVTEGLGSALCSHQGGDCAPRITDAGLAGATPVKVLPDHRVIYTPAPDHTAAGAGVLHQAQILGPVSPDSMSHSPTSP